MANLYHKERGKASQTGNANTFLLTIQNFLAGCARPAILEFGDHPIALIAGEYALECRRDALWVDVWSGDRSLSRRITSIDAKSTASLDCTVQLFGGRSNTLSFLDLERPQVGSKMLRGARSSFAAEFRRMLTRQLPGWDIATLSSGMDLQRSLSPVFPRAMLKRGNQQTAAVACPSTEHESAFLTFALLWHHHLAVRSKQERGTSLCLFLPDGAGTLTAHRLRWLTGMNLATRIFRFNSHGSAGEVDPADLGNLQTGLGQLQCAQPVSEETKLLLERLKGIDGVSTTVELSGATSIRCRGLEFGRVEGGRLSYGIETKVQAGASHFQQVEQLAAQLSVLRRPGRLSSGSGLLAYPEKWLEACVRARIQAIDPALIEGQIHAQVLTLAGLDRDVIDLLGISRQGRLTVLELKTSEDIHLPLQSLDYWMRIAWHAQASELNSLFPEVVLSPAAPKLLLVAPAICFHPTNRTILRHFSQEIEVERVGINLDWQENLRVILRLKGAEMPLCDGSSHEF